MVGISDGLVKRALGQSLGWGLEHGYTLFVAGKHHGASTLFIFSSGFLAYIFTQTS
jgi:hypothetical protein